MDKMLLQKCYVEFDDIPVFYGTLLECITAAIARGFSHKDVDIINEETGEVLDLEWGLHIAIYETRRRVEGEFTI